MVPTVCITKTKQKPRRFLPPNHSSHRRIFCPLSLGVTRRHGIMTHFPSRRSRRCLPKFAAGSSAGLPCGAPWTAGRPLSVVNGLTFKMLVGFLNPEAVAPTPSSVSWTYTLDSMYKEAKARVIHKLKARRDAFSFLDFSQQKIFVAFNSTWQRPPARGTSPS